MQNCYMFRAHGPGKIQCKVVKEPRSQIFNQLPSASIVQCRAAVTSG